MLASGEGRGGGETDKKKGGKEVTSEVECVFSKWRKS